MKATLSFDLPEERAELFSALNGGTWESILYELDQYLRGQIKHNDREELQEIRTLLYNTMNSWNLDWSE